MKRVLIYITFAIVLYTLLANFLDVLGFISHLGTLLLPVLLGFIMAFVLNVPMKGLKKLYDKITAKSERKLPDKAVDIICVVLVFMLLAFIIWLTIMLAVPSVLDTVGSVMDIIEEKLPEIIAKAEELGVDPKVINDLVDFVHIDDDSNVNLDLGLIFGSVFSTATTLISTAISVIFALVVCIYALLSKAEIRRQSRRLSYSILPRRLADYFNHVYELTRDCYAKFLTAQCIEACILGVMMFLAFTVFRIPYAGLVAVLTAIFAFLPYVGAFGSCFIGAFLTLVSEPEKVILCIVVYTIVQFTENQFIYPHVVGNTIGLSPIWTLIAALVGGSLMGLFGMIFFIPLASVVSILLGEFTTARLKKKRIEITEEYESFPQDEPEGVQCDANSASLTEESGESESSEHSAENGDIS